jgi:dihydrofolate reductase
MSISMIVAHDINRAIGKDGTIPWHIPNDLKFFKTMTVGKTVVMGRKTFESIGCKPLPDRRNVVLSRTVDKLYGNVIQFDNAGRVSELAKNDEIFIIGGAELYAQFINIANKLYVTEIHQDIGGDVFFPPVDETRFKLASSWSNSYNDLDYDVKVYLKR